jgi:hypothetical protein
VTAYLLLSVVGFTGAALMSHRHYGFDHQQTIVYYLGNESQMAFPKLYPQLLQSAHVHSFTMPLVFLPVWLGLHFTGLRKIWQRFFILGGALSIVVYNAAPFLLRYGSPHAVGLFTVGGIGLFLFYFAPAAVLFGETWFGFPRGRAR